MSAIRLPATAIVGAAFPRAGRLLLLLLVIGWLGACADAGPSTGPGQLDADQQREAARKYEELLALERDGSPGEILGACRRLRERYPGFTHEDHVLRLEAQAALALGDRRQARLSLVELIDRHPGSADRPWALWTLASLEDESGQWLKAAHAYALVLDHPDDTGHEDRARDRLSTILQTRLDLDQLAHLEKSLEGSSAAAEVAWVAASRSFREEADPERSGERLEAFLLHYPDSAHRSSAREMLAELVGRGVYTPHTELELTSIDRVGLLCPLTGEYAGLGQAMYDGALMALEEHNRLTGDDLKLIALDTQGDGVQAVLSARSLIEDDGVLAIVGSLLSPTTIAAAAVCQERGVPLISPTATQENISLIGDQVFQTNLTGAFETKLVAWAAVDLLLRRRLAILYPNTREGRHAAEIFAREAEALGARIVASEPFDRGITDFKEPIERIRSSGPEALFVPAGPGSMRLIAPQLNFYHLDVQLLGPSSWNNPRVARETGETLDRAIFPSETALMPQAERDRFTRKWIRRHGGEVADPFALKTYFATVRLLRTIHEGARSRERLRDRLASRLLMNAEGEELSAGVMALRILHRGEVEAFPPEIIAAARDLGSLPTEPSSPSEGGADDSPGGGVALPDSTAVHR